MPPRLEERIQLLQPKDEKPRTSENSSCGASVVMQFGHIALLLIKYKAWHVILLLLTVLAVQFNLFSALLSKDAGEQKTDNSGSGATFYGTADFLKSGHKLLIDRSTFPAETEALTSIMAERDAGGTGWLKYCTSETKCRTELISERDEFVSGHIRYTKDATKRTVLECFRVEGSGLRCAFLYQLMAQSMYRSSLPDSTLKSVEFFSLHKFADGGPAVGEANNTQLTVTQVASVPYAKSTTCAAWANADSFSAELFKSLLLSTIGVSFYIIITTVACIRAIKTGGFLQHLFRSGFSVTSYWSAIWLVTIAECALFSSAFVLSHVLYCPGVYPTQNAVLVFTMFTFYWLTLAGITLLAELLIPPLMAMFCLMMSLSAALCLFADRHASIVETAPFMLHVLPPLNIINYTLAHMTFDTGQHGNWGPLAEKPQHYKNALVSNGLAALVIVLLITYLDFLLRSGNGMCLPPYYPLTCSFWCPGALSDTDADKVDTSGSEAEPHIESAAGLAPSIIVDKVSKTYRSCCSAGPKVLLELSCKIYKNQITALIGHNGAGKSTLIKILTGDECPDSGTAYISGFTVTDALKRLTLRGRISVCPQFDCLCGSLTVMEGIQITLTGKGANSDDRVQKARHMLKRLGLGDKENVLSTDLSGGQKRKLNTILALLGDPDVVFLDEPTSGLDPVSRRQLWQLLQEEKLGRSIVLCTQFMDEADILADRKIFLCGGKIVCAGSSMFLKRAFGCSSILSVSLKSESDAPRLMARLQQVRLKNQFKTELHLEVAASNAAALAKAVQVLESSPEIEAFGLSQANLNDIFMRLSGVGSAEIIEAFQSGQLTKFIEKTDKDLMSKDRVDLRRSHGQSKAVKSSCLRQFSALFRTNLRRHLRTRSSLWSRFIAPAALLVLLKVFIHMEASREGNFTDNMANLLSTDRDLLEETDSTSLGENLRTRDARSLHYFHTVCVHEGGTDSAVVNQSCADMASYGTHGLTGSFETLYKPLSMSLASFLEQKGSLQDSCGSEPCWCVVYYISPWLKTQPNRLRKVTIGIFTSGVEPSSAKNLVHPYRKAFIKVSRLFGAGELEKTTALSYLKPLSQYSDFRSELILFIVIFGIFPVSYLGDPIEDIGSRVRCHLRSMGISPLAYWLSIFLQHWIQYAVCFAISVLLLTLSWDRYRHEYFILTACLPALFLGTASNQLTMYAIAAVTRTSSPIVSLACNIFALALPFGLVNFSTAGSSFVLPLILFLPPVAPAAMMYFCVIQASYSRIYYHADSVANIPNLLSNCWNHKYILVAFSVMPIHILVLSAIIAIAENGAAIRAALCRKAFVKSPEASASSVNQGAQKELERLLQSPRSPANVLEVRQLSKTYPNGVRAVRGVTFGVMAGEIFGLLGANGAGKSTSMSVIVGEDSATGGVVEVRWKSSEWASGRFGASMGFIGYCPQHNPLYDNVTVMEHLLLYADIRGLASAAAGPQVNLLIQGLGLQPHRDKFARQLSGGNKRRLCLAISLLGDPSLIVVDEASTGVDPENKRFIWGAIRGMLHEQRSVLVTTHSMEEVEALCSRVGIMNKGSLIAVGTVQQLQSRYGDAFTLDVLLRQESDEVLLRKKSKLKSAILSQFKGAVVVEDLAVCVQFNVPKKSVSSLSNALNWLDTNQSQLEMHYHAFYQMSLDQVFVKLVKQYDSASGPTSK